ncbi:MAG: radical SAM protein [Nitrospirota bacterium]
MTYFLPRDVVLKWLETPCVYHISRDDLYELDETSFAFLRQCASDAGGSSDDREFIGYCLAEGLLTLTKTSGGHPPIHKSPEPSLRYLELQITERCNLKCRHCYIHKDVLSELPLADIRTALKEFEAMQGLRVMITGGEPLLHRNFPELNACLPGFAFRKILFTNGLLVYENLLRDLSVDEIQVSIDGLEEAHDALRGKGSYRKTMKAVNLAMNAGFEVSVATMIHAMNLADFDEMEEIFRKTGIKDWTVDVPCVSGRLKNNEDFQISAEKAGRYLRYGFGESFHTSTPGFACGVHLMSIMANGHIAKCTFYGDQPVGRISNGLRECWEKITPVRLNELECDCEYIESCRGGCRYRAALLGNPCGKDLYKCFSYDIMGKI